MLKPSKFVLILGLTGAIVGLPCLAAAQKDPDAASVAEAIRFERAKQAAADRQARIEEARTRGEKSADRSAPESKPKARTLKTAAAQKTPPAPHNSQ
jgi:hypothetical protein